MTVYMMYPWWRQKAPTLLQIGVLREDGVMFFLGWGQHGCLYPTRAQCTWEVSGPTRRHINFGNDNSFLKTGGASREERLTILNENQVDETKERCPEGGPMTIEASLPWEKTGFSPLGLPVAHVPKGLEAHQRYGLSWSLLGMLHSVLIILNHGFSTRWRFVPSPFLGDIWQCLETICCYHESVAIGI